MGGGLAGKGPMAKKWSGIAARNPRSIVNRADGLIGRMPVPLRRTAEFTAMVVQDGQPVTNGRLELRLSREGADPDIARRSFELLARTPTR